MGAPAAEAAQGVIDDLMPTDDDLLYEEELLRNPYALKMWWRYIQARVDASTKRRYLLYERAVKALPGSYKVRALQAARIAGNDACCCWGFMASNMCITIPNHTGQCVQLWAAYLKERRLAVRGLRVDHPAVDALNNTYERALVSMHKMPRVWTDYLELLVEQRLVTRARRTFDRALTALPVTQHDRIWILYLVSVWV
jgi:pre-mRNA-splicing factor SYF1